MKAYFVISLLLLAPLAAASQWVKQNVATKAAFRGLSVVDDNVVWASGSGGTVVRTINGGKFWNVITIPGAEKLDFRDIEAFDANTAYILSIGNGESSRIYKTIDGGRNWKLQFTNSNEKAFFDAVACWDKKHCIAMSDPVDHKFLLIETTNAGETWQSIDPAGMPAAKDGEAAFAASGTCLIARGQRDAFLVTGGNDARVFKSGDRGKKWKAFDTPIKRGGAGSGIFSIAMFNAKKGVVVGGNYEKPELHDENLAFTNDGGRSFRRSTGLTGYCSGVTFVDEEMIVAVGSSGSDISYDGGRNWQNLDKENYNAVASKGVFSVWAVGAKGLITQFVPFKSGRPN
jgi:photosystem II stability/assembly factor-like uncharacterized protein